MVDVFENDLDGYRQWSEHNRDGYVLNLRTGGVPAMLHRASCSHIYPDPERPDYGDFTKKTKVCSSDRQRLEAWARQAGKKFVLCSSCDV
jgi:hypothetical protein